MLVLAVDTATDTGGAALVRDGALVAEATFRLPSRHSVELVPAIAWIMERAGVRAADLDLVGCAAGPGSFTGLRMGMAAALGLARAAGKPCVGVPSLAAVAYPFLTPGASVTALIDARRGRFYAQSFGLGEGGNVEPRGAPECLTLDELSIRISAPTLLVGDPADTYRSELAHIFGDRALFPPPGLCYHRPQVLGILAQNQFENAGADEPVRPVYLQATGEIFAPPRAAGERNA
ncbi:MAG: tRNA (adenosine(37)-N6)-threonylcarbamoyltransferase complex dimerization subunit type 1 TsaB [Deltaproteobacteria bacterium]|nr:tRNA (adenosine(37)-N6)-threonylcarbamoyltransferase complex dimerization subunit type 1 TsaB [Deltaproteobacteria bacterium]